MPTKKKTDASRGAKKKKTDPAFSRPAPPPRTEAYERALKEYSRALEQLHQGDFAKAMEVFETVEKGNLNEPELAERARTYASVCARKLAPPPDAPGTADEAYLLGVVRANDGMLDEALELLNGALESDPDSPKYLYARASVRALKGEAEQASTDLRRAVEGDPQIRFQATNDPDFENIRDEAAFIDVIEPTPTGA